MVYNMPIFILYRHVIYRWKAPDLSSSSEAILYLPVAVLKWYTVLFYVA